MHSLVALLLANTLIFVLFYFLARPLTRRLFATWPSHGVAAGFLLGQLIFSWVVWWARHAGLPMNTLSMWLALLALMIIQERCTWLERTEIGQ